MLAIVPGPAIYAIRVDGLSQIGPGLRTALSGQAIGANAIGIIIGAYIAVQQLR